MPDVQVLKKSALDAAVGAALDAASTASALHVEVLVTSGPVTVGTNLLPPGIRVGYPAVIDTLIARVGTAPTGSGLSLSLMRAGLTLGSVTIAAGATSSTTTGLSVAIVSGDILTFDVTAIGSTTPGSDLALAIIGG